MLCLNLEEDAPPGRVLAYDSGSSAKLMRLLGVERPELAGEALRITLLTMSGMLSVVADGDGVDEDVWKRGGTVSVCDVEEGVGGALEPDSRFIAELFLECFIALSRGGEGARVDEE